MVSIHNDINKYIGQRITHYREAQGVSINQLAESLLMDKQHLKKVEAGLEEIELDQLVTIAKVLKIPVDCVMGNLIQYRNDAANAIDFDNLLYDLPLADRKLYADFVTATLNILTHIPKRNQKKFAEIVYKLLQGNSKNEPNND